MRVIRQCQENEMDIAAKQIQRFMLNCMSRKRFKQREFIVLVPSVTCFSVTAVITEQHCLFVSVPPGMRTETICATAKAGSRLASKEQAKSVDYKASD